MRERKFKRQSGLPTLYCCPFIKEPPHLADGKYFTPGLIEHVIYFNSLTAVPIFMKKTCLDKRVLWMYFYKIYDNTCHLEFSWIFFINFSAELQKKKWKNFKTELPRINQLKIFFFKLLWVCIFWVYVDS